MNMQLFKDPDRPWTAFPPPKTVLSHVDGRSRGELIIAGERVGDLGPQDRF